MGACMAQTREDAPDHGCGRGSGGRAKGQTLPRKLGEPQNEMGDTASHAVSVRLTAGSLDTGLTSLRLPDLDKCAGGSWEGPNTRAPTPVTLSADGAAILSRSSSLSPHECF